MIDVEELAAALRAALPADLQPNAAELAIALVTASHDPARSVADSSLHPLLQALAGRQVAAGQSLVSFGAGGQFGDVSIGDVAGGNLTRVTLNVAPGGSGDVIVGNVGAGARGVAVGKNIIQIGALVFPIWAVLALAGLLLAAAGAAYLGMRGPQRMGGTFNVAVADFALDADAGPRASAQGARLSAQVFAALRQQQQVYQQSNPADVISIWNDSMSWREKSQTIGFIGGAGPAERERAAQQRLAALGADMLIYGYLDSQGLVTLRFYVPSTIQGEASGSTIGGDYQVGAPIRPGGTSLTTRAGAIFWLIKGLQYDSQGRPARSLEVLDLGSRSLPDWREQGEGKEILYFLQGQAELFLAIRAGAPADFRGHLDTADTFFDRSAASDPGFLRTAIGRSGVAIARAQCSLGASPCPALPQDAAARAAAFAAAQADIEAATADGQHALDLARESPDQLYAQGVAPMSLGVAYLLRGELAFLQNQDAGADEAYARAVELTESGLPAAQAVEDQRLVAQGLLTLGTAHWRRGQIAAAGGDAAAGLDQYRQAQEAFARCITQAAGSADAVITDDVLPRCAERERATQEAAQALGQ